MSSNVYEPDSKRTKKVNELDKHGKLYLDTHPCDKEALEHFEHYKDLRVQALEEYARCYGPLTVDTTSDYDEWTWVMQPWPWEGGSC